MIISDTLNHRVVILEAKNGIYSNEPDFQLVWNSHADGAFFLNYPNDANFLSNGNLLITDRDNHRVIEVDRDSGSIVWQFGVTTQIGRDNIHLNGPHNADRLANGNTILADSNNNRILEVDPYGEIVWTYHPSGGESMNWPRDADVLDNGNVLIVDSRKGRVIELTRSGETVWEFRISILGTLTQPYEADLLNNGNMLISCPGLQTGDIYEIDYATGEVQRVF
jgi:outer membrane protein assembly factor BamB